MSRFIKFIKSYPEIAGPLIAGFFQTSVIGAAMFQSNKIQETGLKIQETSLELQDKIENNGKSFRQDVHDYNKTRFLIETFDKLETTLISVLYGKEHRDVSDGMALILSKYDQEEFRFSKDDERIEGDKSDLLLLQRKQIANNWFAKYKDSAKANTSLDQKRQDSEYQINMYRSLTRDNFIRIHGLLWKYAKFQKVDKRVIESQGFNISEILSAGQAKELLHRYYRFVRYVKPIDERMGYTANDGEIYEYEKFKNTVTSCFADEYDVADIEKTYKNLGFSELEK